MAALREAVSCGPSHDSVIMKKSISLDIIKSLQVAVLGCKDLTFKRHIRTGEVTGVALIGFFWIGGLIRLLLLTKRVDGVGMQGLCLTSTGMWLAGVTWEQETQGMCIGRTGDVIPK